MVYYLAMHGITPSEYAASIPSIESDFEHLTVVIDRTLTTDEVERVSGCLGYALAKMNGESLYFAPEITIKAGQTTITHFWDSTKAHRSSWSIEEALEEAARFIIEGTPVRRTNRSGPIGTRLVEGIGPCHITFLVDGQPEPTPPAAVMSLTGQAQALAELDAARQALNAAQQAYAHAAIRYAGFSA